MQDNKNCIACSIILSKCSLKKKGFKITQVSAYVIAKFVTLKTPIKLQEGHEQKADNYKAATTFASRNDGNYT